MIIESRITEDGDVILIKTGVPVVGVVALTSFVDDTTGENSTVYFEKKFHYSTNGGLVFSDWIELNTVNVQNIVIERIDFFVIEYMYRRIGVGNDLGFHSIHLGGTVNPLPYPVFNSMIFADFFSPTNVDMLEWALNVLAKLYKRGIIPDYVPRNQGGGDKDFIAYWFTVTHFFAILVYYARGFENVPASLNLMREFVKGRGIYMRNNPDADELLYIYNNYVSEIAKRGTTAVYKRGITINGELLRLISIIATDECLFAFTTRGELGWCVGQSSPLYTGADNIKNLIKGYEFETSVDDLSKYPLINDACIAIVNDKMQITAVGAGENSGIGAVGFDDDKVITIDPTLDYEIAFRVQKSDLTADLSFGVILFDENGNLVLPYRITDGVGDDKFFTQKALNIVDTEYWIRGVLHAHDTALISTDVLNIGFGQGLRLPTTARYMMPIILVENIDTVLSTDIVTLSDIKVRPARLWFSRGTMSARNFIIAFLKNNSTVYNNQQVERIINEQFIPYNTFLLLKFL